MSRRVRWLLGLYPREWRERYDEEFAALLEQRPPSVMDAVDIALGALDARLHPQLAEGMELRAANVPRTAVLTLLWAYAGFIVAGSGFRKVTEDGPFPGLMRDHAAPGLSFGAVVAGSVVALLAVLAGGVPIVLAALRRALAARRWRILGLFAVPPLALAVSVAYTLFLVRVVHPAAGRLGVHSPSTWRCFSLCREPSCSRG